MSKQPSKLSISAPLCIAALALVVSASACADEDVGATGAEDGDTGETSAPGDGDGDPSGDGDGDPSGDGDGDPTGDGDGDGDGDRGLACIDMQFVNGGTPGPDYSQFPNVPIGDHCIGTNNQDITDIERVVFIGDSVTVGSPPTLANDFYRTRLANALASKYGLDKGAFTYELWKQADPFNGTSVVKESGDFASCAKWGARNDDLLGQLNDCISGSDFQQRTLVVWTSGGNDANRIAQKAVDGAPISELFAEVESMLDYHHEALDWLVGDPDKFPNGVFVVNANVYEFTDFTGDLLSCPAADLAGYDANPPNPALLLSSLTMINKRYMEMAEEFGVDLGFMFETFCGHGFYANDPSNVCYRGPGNNNFFDLTCIHPTPTGHKQVSDMFYAVIDE